MFVAKVWEKILDLSIEDSAVTELKIQPTLLGERYSPELSACVTNINIGNIGLGQVFRALCVGLLQNLHRFLSSIFKYQLTEMLVSA